MLVFLSLSCFEHTKFCFVDNNLSLGVTMLKRKCQKGKKKKDLQIGTKSPSTHSRNHRRSCSGHDEIEQPLCRCCNRDVECSQSSSRNLRDVNPAHRSLEEESISQDIYQQKTSPPSAQKGETHPTKLKKHRKQINRHNRHIPRRWNWYSLFRRCHANIRSNIKHAQPLCYRRPQETASSTEGICCQEEEEGASDHFEYAVDSCCEEGGCGSCEAEVGEDLGGVVVDCVCS